MRTRNKRLLAAAGISIAATLLVLTRAHGAADEDRGWPNYGNDPGGMRYAELTQINRSNVSKLAVAWSLHTHDISAGGDGGKRSGFEATPIVVDGTMYFSTGFNRVIALDPATGKQLWSYDPKIDRKWQSGDGLISRGVAAWLDAKRAAGAPCRRRIFEATIDARLVALDAATGQPCQDFGEGGMLSLHDVPNFHAGWYHITSPPVVIDDLVVTGSAVDDNGSVEMPSGVVRAFDARTGALRWSWDPLPARTSDATWKTGAANAWSILATDPERHLVFVPTGSPSPDYYGGLRKGDDKWANSIVALHAETGKLAWGFQLVHHDLWDYDSASPPLLATLRHDGQMVPAVIQGNKTGFLYTLERASGRPIFPIHEQPVPQSDLPGEVSAPTQPFPSAPPALVPQHVSEADIWGASEEEKRECLDEFHKLRNDGLFTPPSINGSLSVPGNVGGMTWSGYAYDAAQGLLFVNTNNYPAKVRQIPRADFEKEVHTGERGQYTEQSGAPYGLFRRFLVASKSPLPCVRPPWGTLAAVDMEHGTIRWQVPLGAFNAALEGKGTISLGGPIATAGGLVFIAGTFDPYFRAFDTLTGQELWRARLPNSGHATPMSYETGGRQYVVIAAGGHAQITEESQGDELIAFALPK